MSKIFQALKFSEGEVADTLFPALDESGNVPLATPVSEAVTVTSAPATAHAAAPDLAPLSVPVSRAKAATPQAPEYRVMRLQVRELSPVLPFDDTNMRASEQYRIIRTRIIQHPIHPHIIVISSPGPGDGKSLTAINIAGALSLKTAAKVLLMDADFRRASVHIQIGFPASAGLADVLGRNCPLKDAVIRCEQYPSLYVLPSGDRPANPAELLDSPEWGALCSRLRKEFEYIIVDSPPMEAVADYDLIQATCDGVVVVVRPDHTNRRACFDLIDKVPKGKFIGVLLNCVTEWLLAKPYAYDSYYYRRPE